MAQKTKVDSFLSLQSLAWHRLELLLQIIIIIIVIVIRAVFKINDRRKTKTKTGVEGPMNQSQFLAITCNSLKTREKSRVHGAIGFGSHWLKNWRKSFKPIMKRSNCNHVITFDSHLKTALSLSLLLLLMCFIPLVLVPQEDFECYS